MAEPPGDRILVTGALGQIGTELVSALRNKYGKDTVLATDIREPSEESYFPDGPFCNLSVLDGEALEKIVLDEGIGTVFHLAAILSAAGEKNPDLCHRVNVGGTVSVLEAARDFGLKVFAPSSIAVFGPDSPNIASQKTPLNPTTIYGKTKVTGEVLGMNYFKQYGVDIRGLRFPGLISWRAPAGGGTTDYAVDIFHAAVKDGHYDCFVSEDTRLPMMYIDDAIRATECLMEVDGSRLGPSRAGYNVRGISFTAGELADKISERIPEFTCDFNPDFRQEVADSWPDDIDDGPAKKDWGWQAEFDLDKMVDEMIDNLRKNQSS